MPQKPLPIDQILTLLGEAPPGIAESTAGLTAAQLRATPGAGEWSANEVLAHLRSCADVWGDCIATIIREERPTIRAINPRTWIERTDYLEQDFQPSWQAYTVQRTALLDVLKSLPPESWSRSARVTGAGKALERTVHSYAQWMAEHERPHVKQIKSIASAMRR